MSQKQNEEIHEPEVLEPADTTPTIPDVDVEETTEDVVIEQSEWMTFAEAAKSLGVRFQQVYQRAVMRGKMRWVEDGKRKLVHKADVAEWAKVRSAYFADKA